MPNQSEDLGGRLPLLDPDDLSEPQKELYDRIVQHVKPLAEKAQFQMQTEGGRLIGPFNPVLYSPEISAAFLELQTTEAKRTTLSGNERQVVILTVGAVWQCGYERYAHVAEALHAGMSEEVVRTLAEGGLPDGLSEREQLAHHYARQLAAEHRVDAGLYRKSEQVLGRQGLMDLTHLAGIYMLVCATLNGFEIPVPA